MTEQPPETAQRCRDVIQSSSLGAAILADVFNVPSYVKKKIKNNYNNPFPIRSNSNRFQNDVNNQLERNCNQPLPLNGRLKATHSTEIDFFMFSVTFSSMDRSWFKLVSIQIKSSSHCSIRSIIIIKHK